MNSWARLDELAQAENKLITMWLHGKSPETIDSYSRYALQFLSFTNKSLNAIALEDLQNFANHLAGSPLQPSSQRLILTVVKSLFSYGHRIGALPFNVGVALIVPGSKDTLTERILTELEVATLIRLEPNFQSRTLLLLLYATGMRVSEICGLCWKDFMVRGDELQVSIFGKGGKTRRVLLNNSTICQAIEKLRGLRLSDPDHPVFPSKTGKHLGRAQVLRIVKAAAIRAALDQFSIDAEEEWDLLSHRIKVQGKLLAHVPARKLTTTEVLRISEASGIAALLSKVSPHWLRHAHGSHAMDHQAPIHLVQATLGHANVATTSRYLHAKPSDSSCRFLPR